MALAWKPFHNTASLTAREDGRGYFIHRVGGLFEVVVVAIEATKLGTFAKLPDAKARAEQDLALRRSGISPDYRRRWNEMTSAPAASTPRLRSGQPKGPA